MVIKRIAKWFLRLTERYQSGVLASSELRRLINSGELVIEGIKPSHIQGASIDVLLGYGLKEISTTFGVIDLMRTSETIAEESIPAKSVIINDKRYDYYYLKANHCYLGVLWGNFVMPVDVLGEIEGKSSVGRVFLETTHGNVGFIDPAFKGSIVIELCPEFDTIVYVGSPIAQMKFTRVVGTADPYKGKYLFQKKEKVQGSMYEKNFEQNQI